MTIRCKFKLNQITRRVQSVVKRDEGGKAVVENSRQVYEEGEVWDLDMSPVYANGDPNHENSKFWEMTPGGSFKVATVNKAAVESMVLGAEYYIDITPAPAP